MILPWHEPWEQPTQPLAAVPPASGAPARRYRPAPPGLFTPEELRRLCWLRVEQEAGAWRLEWLTPAEVARCRWVRWMREARGVFTDG